MTALGRGAAARCWAAQGLFVVGLFVVAMLALPASLASAQEASVPTPPEAYGGAPTAEPPRGRASVPDGYTSQPVHTDVDTSWMTPAQRRVQQRERERQRRVEERARIRALRAADPNWVPYGVRAELYLTATGVGVLTGFGLPLEAGFGFGNPFASGGDHWGHISLMVIGGGLMVIPVAVLDATRSLTTGIAASLAVSARLGGLAGVLTAFALDEPLRGNMAAAVGIMWGSLVVGAALGFATDPAQADVRLVENAGLWGGTIGMLLAVAIDPSGWDENSLNLGAPAAGIGIGMLGATIACLSGLRLRDGQAWLLTLGALVGAGVGALVQAFALLGGGEWEDELFGASTIVGEVAGIAVTGGILAATGEGEDAVPEDVTMSASIAPTQGGAMGTLLVGF